MGWDGMGWDGRGGRGRDGTGRDGMGWDGMGGEGGTGRQILDNCWNNIQEVTRSYTVTTRNYKQQLFVFGLHEIVIGFTIACCAIVLSSACLCLMLLYSDEFFFILPVAADLLLTLVFR